MRTIVVANFDSSAIASAMYDRKVKTLAITFTSGKTYTYYRVPEQRFTGLKRAASAGRYFSKHIRNTYSQERHP